VLKRLLLGLAAFLGLQRSAAAWSYVVPPAIVYNVWAANGGVGGYPYRIQFTYRINGSGNGPPCEFIYVDNADSVAVQKFQLMLAGVLAGKTLAFTVDKRFPANMPYCHAVEVTMRRTP
jgi:hypothetical protein